MLFHYRLAAALLLLLPQLRASQHHLNAYWYWNTPLNERRTAAACVIEQHSAYAGSPVGMCKRACTTLFRHNYHQFMYKCASTRQQRAPVRAAPIFAPPPLAP
ncbi:hypothetical protein JKP88DRAFT_231124, partial [Tribonema minus]